MKTILIVDDNQNNRILLRAVLEEYAEENGAEFVIDEAANGAEAVRMAEKKGYALILMDIMMPEMDGIEATRRIRQNDTKVMIVAVSAVDDTVRQKEILRSGAEDYISKPINVDILTARLGNYIALIDSRLGKPQGGAIRSPAANREARNLYSRGIYSRKVTFFVETEDDLAEFWEYYLLKAQSGSTLLSDTVRTVYAVGSIGLKFDYTLPIWIEESDAYLYFTMEGLDDLDPKFIRLVLAKNPGITDYKFEGGRFCVRVPSSQLETPPVPLQPEPKPAAAPEPQPAPASAPVPEPVHFATTDASANRTFDYMDEEDLRDIRTYLGKLNSLLLIVGSGDISADEVDEIAAYLERAGKIASVYSESYMIGQALTALSGDIRRNAGGFIEKSASLGALCAAFSRDLMSWLTLIFEEGAPNVNYMDDTISANAQMISSMLMMDENADAGGNLDDIFDF